MRAGDPPRTRLVLRVIAVERSLRGLLLLAAGTYLLLHLSTDLGRLAERIMRSVDIDPRQHFFHPIVARLHRLHAHDLRIAGLAVLGYGGLELVEGVGLWLDQLWAEYLTVIATSLLIPFELYELARTRPSGRRAGSSSTSDRHLPGVGAAAQACGGAAVAAGTPSTTRPHHHDRRDGGRYLLPDPASRARACARERSGGQHDQAPATGPMTIIIATGVGYPSGSLLACVRVRVGRVGRRPRDQARAGALAGELRPRRPGRRGRPGRPG